MRASKHQASKQPYLAQAMSWMTEPKSRNVQLKARPTFLQCLPSSPSSTSNHCRRSADAVRQDKSLTHRSTRKLCTRARFRKSQNLDDMVPEVRLLPLLPGPVLHVENADEVRRPAAHQPVQELEQYAAQHPQLRERVGQGQEHLSHLMNTHITQAQAQCTNKGENEPGLETLCYSS